MTPPRYPPKIFCTCAVPKPLKNQPFSGSVVYCTDCHGVIPEARSWA